MHRGVLYHRNIYMRACTVWLHAIRRVVPRSLAYPYHNLEKYSGTTHVQASRTGSREYGNTKVHSCHVLALDQSGTFQWYNRIVLRRFQSLDKYLSRTVHFQSSFVGEFSESRYPKTTQ